MKKMCKVCFLFIFLLLIPINIFAKNKELFSCNYNVKYINNDETFPLKVTVFDNNTVKFENNGKEIKNMSFIFDKQGNQIGARQLVFKEDSFLKVAMPKSSECGCPQLQIQDNGDVMLYLNFLSNKRDGDTVNVNGPNIYYTDGVSPIYTKEGKSKCESSIYPEEEKKCKISIPKGDGNKFKTDLTLSMDKKNKKKFCIKVDGRSEACQEVSGAEEEALFYQDNKSIYFYIKKSQVNKIWVQDDRMINEGVFDCPKELFLYQHKMSDANLQKFYITTDKDEAKKESLTNNASSSLDNNKNNDDNDIPGTEVTGCEVVPKEVQKWIRISLNFVKYIALILVIVLGTIDFIKAAGSGEPDAMKKAGQSFIKRVVAVIILFLLPMIVELILHLINLYGSTDDCFNVLS